MMLDRQRLTITWRIFLLLVRYWRWMRRPTEIRNEDLPFMVTAMMEGRKPPDFFSSNGSTFSPDRALGADLRPAAHWHDWAYAIGGSEADRKEADYVFYRNLTRCGLATWLARRYFYRVRFWGVHCFKYTDSSCPRGWARVALFFNRYLEF